MNITKNRKIWFSLSAILAGASILLMIALGFNLGLDFTGGARWNVSFTSETPVEQATLAEFFENQEILEKDTMIQSSEDGSYLITVEDLDDASLQTLKGNLETSIGAFDEISYRKVDSSIGQSFKRKSFIAILVALAGIIIFVAWAFRKVPKSVNPWRFGGVAILALFHDIIIIAGVFALLGSILDIEVDLQFITALLATLGFSVNDTIVILDRVRENIRKQKPTETFDDTVEKSVQQTLHRSVNTSLSTLLPLIALYFFGAESIKLFVLALILGIAIGTYSSIFLAAPMLAGWKKWADKRS